MNAFILCWLCPFICYYKNPRPKVIKESCSLFSPEDNAWSLDYVDTISRLFFFKLILLSWILPLQGCRIRKTFIKKYEACREKYLKSEKLEKVHHIPRSRSVLTQFVVTTPWNLGYTPVTVLWGCYQTPGLSRAVTTTVVNVTPGQWHCSSTLETLIVLWHKACPYQCYNV